MKKIYIILTLLLVTFSNNIAQPVISYITPDIGAPGMAVYVEFIGPHFSKNNFGFDGPYLSKSQETEIILADDKDIGKVKIGPIVVSWEGRMLSTILYINDNLDPNQYDALSVSPTFQIELKVRVGSQVSNSQTFYIVKSRPFIDLSNAAFVNDSVLGSKNMGKRSPRGAMIYDSMKLGSRKYWVSTDDTDPNIAGNQGLLPFTLLVKGKISGTPGSSKITANGGEVLENGKPNGMVQDAAPGGGGGGGSFSDFSGIGYRGGNGFTGGGPGGRNKSGNPFTNDDYTKPPSVGSGPYLAGDDKHGGYSLNGVPGPVLAAYESAGGATGHPFGRSGEGCGDGANCEPSGREGGGSGWKQNSPGGSGAYATNGSSSGSNAINGGKSHGNIMIVPLAGGSGGAGGNPNCFPPGQSAAGGAGGGSIRLFALQIEGVDFEAVGADGATNDCDESEGGSGSGGHVGVQSKLMINKTKIKVDGGANNRTVGGAGRVRTDYPVGLDINLSTANASLFRGPTTDTTHIIRSNHILTGSQAPGMISNLYVSKDNGDWRLITVLTDQNWSYDLTTYLNKQSGTYYVAVASIVVNPNITDHAAEPHEVLSQAAANILKLDLRPFINGDKNVKAKKIYCIGETITLSAKIWNESLAEANLEIFLSDLNWLGGDTGFKILGPVKNETYGIKPNDTAEIIVEYTMPSGADPSQPASNILLIPSNDPDHPAGKDWLIQFNVDAAYTPELSFDGAGSSFPIKMDTTKVGLTRDTSYVLVNSGNSDLYLLPINNLPAPFQFVSTEPSLPTVLKMGEKIKINIKFNPTTKGDFSTIIALIAPKTDSTCAFEQHTEINAVAVVTDIDIESKIDFGLVPYCENPIYKIKMKNLSATKLTITMFPKIIGTDADLFQVIKKQEDVIVLPPFDPSEPEIGVIYDIQFFPDKTRKGPISATFYFTTDDAKFDTVFVDISAEIVTFEVIANPTIINLGNVPIGFVTKSSFTLSNSAKLDNKIGSIVSNSGFATIEGLSDSTIVALAGTKIVDFSIKPLTKGAINDSIIVYINEPCLDSIAVYFKGNALESNPLVYMDEDIIIKDTNTAEVRETTFGDFSTCETVPFIRLVEYVNSSPAPYIVIKEELINDAGGRYRFISSSLTVPDTLYPNGETRVPGAILEFNPIGASVGNHDGVIRITLLINGLIKEYNIILRSWIYIGKFSIIQNPVNMFAVVGNTVNYKFTIENLGPEQLVLSSYIPPSLPNIFKITPDPVSISLDVNDSQEFNVAFSPVLLINYKDSITFLSTNSNCDSNFVVYLNGKGEPSKELLVYLPDLLTTPDQKNFKIPVLGKFKKDTDFLTDMNITMNLRFNRSLYLPESIENGEFVNNTIDGRDRVLKLKFNNFKISPTDSIIGYLSGTTLLGDTKTTNMIISNLDIAEKELVSSIESKDGTLSIEICEEGGERLLEHQLNPFSININPNPANEIINISIKTLEKGIHSIIISDISGREVYSNSWDAESIGSEKSLKINSNYLNSGIYFVKVYSPNDVKFSKINLIK